MSLADDCGPLQVRFTLVVLGGSWGYVSVVPHSVQQHPVVAVHNTRVSLFVPTLSPPLGWPVWSCWSVSPCTATPCCCTSRCCTQCQRSLPWERCERMDGRQGTPHTYHSSHLSLLTLITSHSYHTLATPHSSLKSLLTPQTILGYSLVIVNSVVIGFLCLQFVREWLYTSVSAFDRDGDGWVS